MTYQGAAVVHLALSYLVSNPFARQKSDSRRGLSLTPPKFSGHPPGAVPVGSRSLQKTVTSEDSIRDEAGAQRILIEKERLYAY